MTCSLDHHSAAFRGGASFLSCRRDAESRLEIAGTPQNAWLPMKVAKRAGSPFEVLLIFLKLGLSCFGGPIAHIGYFRDEFVVRRRWLDESAYADLVAEISD